MAVIFETKDFSVETPDTKPHHSRSNGGHVKVSPRIDVDHRQELPLDIAAGLMHLPIVTGEAVTNVMRANGIDVVRINYQDNGNWAHRPDRNCHAKRRWQGRKLSPGRPMMRCTPCRAVRLAPQ